MTPTFPDLLQRVRDGRRAVLGIAATGDRADLIVPPALIHRLGAAPA